MMKVGTAVTSCSLAHNKSAVTAEAATDCGSRSVSCSTRCVGANCARCAQLTNVAMSEMSFPSQKYARITDSLTSAWR